MTHLSNLPPLPPLNEEMRLHFERLLWGPGIGSSVLGRNRKTVQRWFNPLRMVEVERSDLALVREIVAFVDEAAALHYDTPPGPMTGEEFRECIYALGWNVRSERHPAFAEVARLRPRHVRLMSVGRMPVSMGMQERLDELMQEMVKPPFLAARAKAKAMAHEPHDDMQEGEDHEA